MEAIRISDFRLYREISDGKSITYMIAGLNKEYGDVVESGLLLRIQLLWNVRLTSL